MTASTSLPQLSRSVLLRGVVAQEVARPTAAMLDLPERAVQFGTGAFLRGFIDGFLDDANAAGRFNGRVVAIGSTGSGRDRAFAEQNGLYTLVTRGIMDGVAYEATRIVGAVSRAVSAVDDWEAVLACARNPQLSVVFSNTTEVGIHLDVDDTPTATPPRSFPGKLTRFLYERAVAFAFAPSKGVVVLPCELIEHNGAVLSEMVHSLAERWGYPTGFRRWLDTAVPFCNTLVDRIVPGAPDTADHDALRAHLGYEDQLMTTAEPYRLLVIEGGTAARARLDFLVDAADVILTDDLTPFRRRKVQLLNGAHTIAVSVALLAGCVTVADAMQHPLVGAFLRRVLVEEILPEVEAPDAAPFARAVLDRFANPSIRHALADITLQGTMKMRVRIVPTLVAAARRTGRVPDALQFGFAAHLAYLHPEVRAAREAAGLVVRADDLAHPIALRWTSMESSPSALVDFVRAIAADVTLWGTDLSALPGFVDGVAVQLQRLQQDGALQALESLLMVPSP